MGKIQKELGCAALALMSARGLVKGFSSSTSKVYVPPMSARTRRTYVPASHDDHVQDHFLSSTGLCASIQDETSTEVAMSDGIINGGAMKGGKFEELLESVGLKDKLRVAHDLPDRIMSTNDVFCNRETKLGSIRAIGFDMDFTLVQYKEPAFGNLAFEGAKEKLVSNYNYPKEVLDLTFDHTWWRRGLIIDTQRGNFLKIDRHKYCRLAYHGFTPIPSDERKITYSKSFNKVMSFTEKSYVNMDTLFQHVDAHLFAHLVELKDSLGDGVLDGKTYADMYKDVRACIDLCHRDGVIKDEVARDPSKYIELDQGMIDMLQQYRDAGVNTFLLTNSLWEYTSVAMNYLYHGTSDYDPARKDEWLKLFDLAIVGSCKPAFMLDPYLNLFRVNTKDGTLKNTDGLFDIAAMDSPEQSGASAFLFEGKVFQGGNWQHLHALLEIEAGEDVLYVGDHLYSDVLRSKRTLGWRTALIVPELDHEMKVFREKMPMAKRVTELRKLRDELSHYGDVLRRELNLAKTNEEKEKLLEQLERIEADDVAIKEVCGELNYNYHMAFHPVWGQMFKAGYQDSRFAFYTTNYSCLYTSKASNLGLASTERSYRTGGERSPHDLMISAADAFEAE
uniref:5'-nucleotidase n=1 Tax=Leptocylindrus danicus TaxID=163516 RepID=A0A7S2P8U0_9STRA|mmetsp:Transcript_25622/g.38286  ORF Transcript_25622/g.38286 Transcript_25622/m.38286 type:complete len:619 (+) Transcript_25622:169-2025(+)|eukprot:CAMPEP_0116019724 /NCGR_PEP_ID=MMETSP0321-20121206/9398_1 /TAXON_ID=163516 /ORGANISM="Leptocylindrus danicus var. danicus, Strain B650" /LENGTH=618 /DNA_ID=CAMNT_0003490331 /DNA_START=145 /DNA_END=2001 /DNA_ORIENTATION=+